MSWKKQSPWKAKKYWPQFAITEKNKIRKIEKQKKKEQKSKLKKQKRLWV